MWRRNILKTVQDSEEQNKVVVDMGVIYTYPHPCLSKNAVKSGLNLKLSVKLGRGKGLEEQKDRNERILLWWEVFLKKVDYKKKLKQYNNGTKMVHNQTGRMPSSEDVHMWNDLPNRDWENREWCFFGLLKLWLKILAASLQPYVLFMFFVKTFFITWLYIQVISYIQPGVK